MKILEEKREREDISIKDAPVITGVSLDQWHRGSFAEASSLE